MDEQTKAAISYHADMAKRFQRYVVMERRRSLDGSATVNQRIRNEHMRFARTIKTLALKAEFYEQQRVGNG